MTTTVVDRPRVGDAPIMLSAWSMIAGGVMMIVLGIPLASLQDSNSPAFGLIAALNAVSHLMLLAGVVGLARSGAAGRGRLAAAGLALTLLGLVVLVAAEAAWLTGLGAADALYSLATLALALGPILAGIAIVRAGRWGGWRRFALLACGLYVPLVLLPSFALPGFAMNYALGLWGVCWLLVGLALRAEAG